MYRPVLIFGSSEGGGDERRRIPVTPVITGRGERDDVTVRDIAVDDIAVRECLGCGKLRSGDVRKITSALR